MGSLRSKVTSGRKTEGKIFTTNAFLWENFLKYLSRSFFSLLVYIEVRKLETKTKSFYLFSLNFKIKLIDKLSCENSN